MGNRLVLIVHIEEESHLNGLRHRMMALVNSALQYAGLGLTLERVYEVPAMGATELMCAAERVAFDLNDKIAMERVSPRRPTLPPMH